MHAKHTSTLEQLSAPAVLQCSPLVADHSRLPLTQAWQQQAWSRLTPCPCPCPAWLHLGRCLQRVPVGLLQRGPVGLLQRGPAAGKGGGMRAWLSSLAAGEGACLCSILWFTFK
jgi:hypothetical protein